MQVLILLAVAGAVLLLAGRFYSRFLARSVGEDPARRTPAVALEDGRDYVPTPTPVVFAHHFASIAGAGPILGPVIAILYGWLPAVLWVLFGGTLIGAVHDYLAVYLATREGGLSIATIARRMLGKDVFVAVVLFLIIMLALVCAAFLNASATALVSMLPFSQIELPAGQSIFRVVGEKVVIGGIASTSVIVITAVAPLLGWLYIKRKVKVWVCSVLAVVICAGSITAGLFAPLSFPDQTHLLGLVLTGETVWKLLLSAYVLVAAGVPVWIFLQSRDFINVHILYLGMAGLLATLLVAGARGAGVTDPIPALNLAEAQAANGPVWPTLFILIACGAVSGFHSLCASGTTCKQLTSESAARRIGYHGMLLESFLAVCVIATLMVGVSKGAYLGHVYPKLAGLSGHSNPIVGFALAVGHAVNLAWGAPVAVGAVAGMVLLEGFVVTTLDTAIRLTRYLFEEIWRTMFEAYDVFAAPVAATEAQATWPAGDLGPAGTDGIPAAPPLSDSPPAPAFPTATMGPFRILLTVLRQYWFNSGLAVAMMLVFAFSGGVGRLWSAFATSNQLLAAIVLALAALWLLRKSRRFWFAVWPAAFMFATTGASLVMMFNRYRAPDSWNAPLLGATVVMMVIPLYLLLAGTREVLRLRKQRKT